MIGTVCQYSDADSARTAIIGLLTEINSNGLRRDPFPLTVKEVCNHFEQRELTKDNIWRSYSTKKSYRAYLNRWIIPHWGTKRLSEVRTIQGAKRRTAPSVLTPAEIKSLLTGLGLRERVLVLLAASLACARVNYLA